MQASSGHQEKHLVGEIRKWRSIATAAVLLAAVLGVALATDDRWSYVVWGNVAQWVAAIATSAALVFGAQQIRFLYRQAQHQLTAERNRGYRLATTMAVHIENGWMRIFSRSEFGFDDLRVRFDGEDPLWFYGIDSNPQGVAIKDGDREEREVVRLEFKERAWTFCRVEFLMLGVWFQIDVKPEETAHRPAPIDGPSLDPKESQAMLYADRY